jgi:hypothetical protein
MKVEKYDLLIKNSKGQVVLHFEIDKTNIEWSENGEIIKINTGINLNNHIETK